MIAQLNHMNSDTPSDIAARVAARIESVEELILRLEEDPANDGCIEHLEAREELSDLKQVLRYANHLIGFLNEEFNAAQPK